MAKVCILDYGSGNVRSVMNSFMNFADCEVSNETRVIRNASHIVLPGVGSYKNSMALIREKLPMTEVINQIALEKPFLGICVGMQVLGSRGVEFEEALGLGIIPGVVSKIDCGKSPLPHVGWNNLTSLKSNPLTSGISNEDDFYFVHSFAFSEISEEFVIAETEYGTSFPAIINFRNIFGVQFHPEKSQKAGEKIIKNFLAIE
jgi:glutamine amidotransferase